MKELKEEVEEKNKQIQDLSSDVQNMLQEKSVCFAVKGFTYCTILFIYFLSSQSYDNCTQKCVSCFLHQFCVPVKSVSTVLNGSE